MGNVTGVRMEVGYDMADSPAISLISGLARWLVNRAGPRFRPRPFPPFPDDRSMADALSGLLLSDGGNGADPVFSAHLFPIWG